MSGSIMTILFVLPVVLLSMLLPLALVVALQVWLCRKGKWLGLILPAITLAMSLMICLSVVGFSAVTGGGSVQVTDGHGNIVEEYHREEEHHQLQPADLAMVGVCSWYSTSPLWCWAGSGSTTRTAGSGRKT